MTNDQLQLADVRRRLGAIFVGSIGNLVEWYDFYAYAAFADMPVPASTASSRSREPDRKGERMMVITVSGLYRRVAADV